MEHRRFTRIPLDTEVIIEDSQSHKKWLSELIDISLKGLKISRPIDWLISNHVHFEITLMLAKNDIEIKIQSELKHFDDSVLGFQLMHIDVDSASHLHRLLELNLGDNTLLDREYHELISPNMSKP